MSNANQIYSIGSIGDGSGSLYFHYMPEYGSVSITASVPSDKRRADISVRTNVSVLRTLIGKIDEVIEISKRAQLANDSARQEADGISFKVLGSNLIVTNSVLAAVKSKIDAGNNDAVIKEVKLSLPFLSEDAAKDLAFKIYKHFRPRV